VRAAVHTRYGPPEVVEVRDVPTPAAGAGALLVRVHATTVNRTDCHYRSATPFPMRVLSGLTRPKATILGNEFAGVVEATGTGVHRFAVGDRVFGYCEGPFGAHAEHLVVPEDRAIAAIPDRLSFEQVAPGRRARTTRSTTSPAPAWRPGWTCSCTARPGRSAQQRCSS
jgi:NADPH:quinone reductase-like Zn-dependent oxidoreductase